MSFERLPGEIQRFILDQVDVHMPSRRLSIAHDEGSHNDLIKKLLLKKTSSEVVQKWPREMRAELPQILNGDSWFNLLHAYADDEEKFQGSLDEVFQPDLLRSLQMYAAHHSEELCEHYTRRRQHCKSRLAGYINPRYLVPQLDCSSYCKKALTLDHVLRARGWFAEYCDMMLNARKVRFHSVEKKTWTLDVQSVRNFRITGVASDHKRTCCKTISICFRMEEHSSIFYIIEFFNGEVFRTDEKHISPPANANELADHIVKSMGFVDEQRRQAQQSRRGPERRLDQVSDRAIRPRLRSPSQQQEEEKYREWKISTEDLSLFVLDTNLDTLMIKQSTIPLALSSKVMLGLSILYGAQGQKGPVIPSTLDQLQLLIGFVPTYV